MWSCCARGPDQGVWGVSDLLSDLRQRAADLNLLTDVHIRQGFSIRELVKIAASVGVVIEAKLVDLTHLQQQRRPVIAWLSFARDNNHFTVVNPGSLATGHLLLADPTLGNRRVSERHFLTGGRGSRAVG